MLSKLPSIPKLSAPLVKDIRTGEGILEWALAGLGVAAGATGNLSVAKTGTYLTILAGAKGLRRLLLKITASQSTLGIGAPLLPAVFSTTTVTAEQVLDEIAAVDSATSTVQAQPGTPLAAVSAGLAPDPEPPAAA